MNTYLKIICLTVFLNGCSNYDEEPVKVLYRDMQTNVSEVTNLRQTQTKYNGDSQVFGMGLAAIWSKGEPVQQVESKSEAAWEKKTGVLEAIKDGPITKEGLGQARRIQSLQNVQASSSPYDPRPGDIVGKRSGDIN